MSHTLPSPTAPPGASPPGAAPDSASNAAWQQRLLTQDLDAHARAQAGWDLHYEQLSEGRFAGELHHVQLPQLRVVLERCSVAVRQRGPFAPGQYGFAMALEAPDLAIFNGQRVERDAIMLGRNRGLDLCTPAGYALIAVVVDEALLVPVWQSLYGKSPSAWIESQLVVPGRPVPAQALRGCHLQALDTAAALLARGEDGHGRAALQLRDSLLIEWLEALPESIDASGLPTALARKRLVDRACERMLAQPDEPLSLLQVCREVGASRRKLNYCFQEALGVSPLKYLRAVRLNGVRRELRDGAAAVQDVAHRWGFWHLGQFARDYKRQFGELPSQTLRGKPVVAGPNGKP